MFRTVIFLAAVIFLLLSSAAAYSMDAVVDKVAVTNNQEDIQISFEIRNAFTKEIEEGIKSGIPATFTFFVELYRKRGLWFDQDLASVTFKHTMRYDSLKEEYEIMLEEKLQSEADSKSAPALMRIKEIEQAKKMMAVADNVVVKPSEVLKKGEKYQLKIKATLDAVNLPFPLNYMLFFVSFWNYETNWYEKEFTP